MKFNELIQGRVYVTYNNNPGYIFQCKGDCKNISYCSPGFTRYFSGGYLNAESNPSFSDYREATPEESARMMACIVANKLVEAPIIKEDYTIY